MKSSITYRNGNKKRLALFIFMLIISFHSYSQIQRNTFHGFLIGMNTGFNSSKLKIDSILLEPSLLPVIGLNVEKKAASFLAFRFGIGYARRGSNSENGIYEYRNDYFDMDFQARVLAGDYIKFCLGFQRAGLLGSYVKIYDEYFNYSTKWENTTGFSNQYHWQVGISSAIINGFDIEINYNLPAAKHDYHCIRFSVNLYPGELKRKRKLNKYTSISDAIVNPYVVEKLVLHRQNLNKIPSEVYSFTNLRELVLDGNQIKVVSPEIGKLKNLRYLSLQYNMITKLPREIGQLKKLEEIHLHRNQLDSLPKEIGQLTNLKFLYIGKNNLTCMPEELGQLENLIELDVAQSGVMLTIPASIQNLQRLERLYIDETTILPYSLNVYNQRLKIILK
ncbi:MAG: leucine-rich repeat domain-containing protein [Bacteroidota bacterium]|nr:leucine-rich repeat domain-containing protein [Bacteroidota bacterium]